VEEINFLKFVKAVTPIRLFQNIVWTNYIKKVLTVKHGWQSYHEICGHTVFNNVVCHVIQELPENKYVWYNKNWSETERKVEEYKLDFAIVSIACRYLSIECAF
tara:strand:- start:2302 stop:2613 length:312 start_codon:yes stop_codon:yes gene_type:complete